MDFYVILLFILGLLLVVFGSDFLVDGSSDIAHRCGISDFVIGLTIVGLGTSTPEMVVSFISAIQGNADMSVGNIIGSNIFNTLLILGLTAVIMPVAITKTNMRRDIPMNILAALFLVIKITGITGNTTLTRLDGAFMLLLFALYMVHCFRDGKDEIPSDPQTAEPDGGKRKPLVLSILMVVGGLVALIIGGELFVDGAKAIARYLGWSDKFIAVTILAGGTSLPELATCVVAAVKKKGQLALGNIIGSNISNILLILGGSALINPLTVNNISMVDMGILMASSILIGLTYITWRRGRIDRMDGILMLLMEAGYMFYLISEL